MSELPEYVIVCPLCEGKKSSFRPCEMCLYPGHAHTSAGYVYKSTGKAVPKSVVAQIEHAATAADQQKTQEGTHHEDFGQVVRG